jgi:hypothetical protein
VPIRGRLRNISFSRLSTLRRARIENAQMIANIEGFGHAGRQRLELEPLSIVGTITYRGSSTSRAMISTEFSST